MKPINKKQKGFSILAVILIIIATVVAIGFWVFSGTSNASSLNTVSSNVEATNIINQATALQSAYNILLSKGYTKDTILIVNDPLSPNYLKENNIYNFKTSMEAPVISPNAFHPNLAPTEGYWVFNFKGVQVSGRSNSFAPGDDIYPAVLIAGIKDSVCKSINQSIKNNPTIPNASSGVTGNMLTGAGDVTLGATKKLPISIGRVYLDTMGMFGNWSKGCFNANIANSSQTDVIQAPDQNIYFHFLD